MNDGLVNGDDHIRGTKLALKNSFPQIAGAVTASHTDLSTVGSWVTGGAPLLSGAGTYFNVNPTDGFRNTVAGDIDVVLAGTIAATFQRTAGVNFFKVSGGIQATAEIKGPGVCPPGSTVIWWDDTLPEDGLWAWANGQVITDAATRCPILLARWGSRFGGNGVTSMGLPNLQEVVPVGKSGMGGGLVPGVLSSIAGALKTALHALIGADAVTLTTGHLPNLESSGTNLISLSGSTSNVVYGYSGTSDQYGPYNGSAVTAYGPVPVNVSGSVNITTRFNGGGNAHNNVQPSRTVNWIVRLG
ncbi:phage tail protein [Rhodopseudomonas palustris]|uniref:phage tail protein n=1 Tax=Rhodopseudomonas palustris TaxID=1076 RepID=UPI0018DCE7CD|nr:tail fiber protein [Rhodopseudomonas palustris]